MGGHGTISGFVFRDHDADGVRDQREPGEPGVIVSAYDIAGQLVISTTTGVDGSFRLGSNDEASPIRIGEEYRVEFIGLPDYLRPGPSGRDSGTDVQFVRGGAANIGFGVLRADQYLPPGS